jgi:GAF domain-containing protein
MVLATIEGCDYAGIVLVQDGDVTTRRHTNTVVAELDTLRHRCGEGPCLDAIAQTTTVYAEDLADDPRWGRFGMGATARGVRSQLAIPIVTDATLGALNVYGRFPHAFGVMDRARGQLLAALAALSLSTAMHHEDEERREANLQAALATREVIGQAQGILIERERITADQAFDILRRASQHLNLKLREVAQTLVDTGEDPGRRPPAAG